MAAQLLVGVSDRFTLPAGAESALVGRRWEMSAVEGLLERAVDGHGAVVTVVGSPGIGKSRLVREVAALAWLASCERQPSPDRRASSLSENPVFPRDLLLATPTPCSPWCWRDVDEADLTPRIRA